MSDIQFLKNYFTSFTKLLNNENYFKELVNVKNILVDTNSKGKKTLIFGIFFEALFVMITSNKFGIN